MDFEAVTKYVLEQFEKHKVRYALIGGFALNAIGFARATQDIDFLVHHQDVVKVKNILTPFGYEIGHESQDALNFWGTLKQLGGVDFIIAHRPYALAMLERAKIHEGILGYSTKVVIPEDMIALKLQAMANDPDRSLVDMADIRWLLKNHKQSLDINLLKEYFKVFDKTDLLEDLLNAQ